MANIKSAKKRIKISANRRLENKGVKSAVKTHIRKFEETLAHNPEEAGKMLPLVLKKLDQASAKGLIHRNTVNRQKSRLMRKYNDLSV